MVCVHMRERACFRLDQVRRAGDGRSSRSAAFRSAARAKPALRCADTMLKPPEREVGKAGIQLGLRVAGEEPPAQPRFASIAAARPAQIYRAPSGADGRADRRARPDANSSDARPSFSRLAVWVASREIKMSGEPSTSVATLTNDANGWPVLRSMVASAPARVARNSALAIALRVKIGRRRVFRQAIGHHARQRSGLVGCGPSVLSLFRRIAAIAPILPCLVTLPPLHGFSKAYGAGADDACGRLMLEGRHADNRSRR